MARPYRILIVEDDIEINLMLARAFSSLGYEVASVDDGFQALERIEGEYFNVVILDLMLPGPNGIKVLKHIREQWPTTEVIMLTAYASLDTAIEALRMGAYDYVTKPFPFDVLRSTVGRAVEKQRLETKLEAIYDLSREMALSLDVGRVAEVVLDIVERVLEFGTCSLMMVDEGQGELYRLTGRGGEGKTSLKLPLNGEEGITVAVVRTGDLLYIPNVGKDSRYVEIRAATRSELAVPLKVKDRVIGVLDVESTEAGAFTQADEKLLSALAAQAAVAIESARLYEQAQREIVERRRVEKALRESEETARALLNAPTDAATLIDVQGIILGVNETVARRFQRSMDELVGMCVWDLFLPDMAERAKRYIDEVIQTGEPIRFEDEYQGIWNDNVLYPVHDAQGNVTKVAMLARDITERKYTEDALRRRNRELTEFNDISATIIATLELDQVLQRIVESVDRLFPQVHRTTIQLLDEVTNDLITRATSLGSPNMLSQTMLDVGESIVELVMREYRPVNVADVMTDPRLVLDGAKPPFRSLLVVPLLFGEQIFGTLSLEGTLPMAFGDEDERLAQLLSGYAAIAVGNARLFEQLSSSRKQIQALSRRHVEAQEAERAHIARELHDETGQALSAMLLSLSLFEREVDCPEAVIARAIELEKMVDEMLENLHRLAMNLRPASLDHLGLVPAMAQYIETFGHQHNLTTHFETLVGIDGERLPASVETALYRIVQETLTNVTRHAQATRVDVLLERRDDQIVTIVEDDGVGFDIEEAMQSSRLGLFGMRERAEMLGGTLNIESTIGAGTTVFVEIPYDQSSEDARAE